MRKNPLIIYAIIFTIILLSIGTANAQQTQDTSRYSKTELYFGLTYSGGRITTTQWQQFLDKYITKAFPDGFTVINAYGQWFSTKKKVINREPSKMVIIIHKNNPQIGEAIDQLRKQYCKMFDQESVLRADADLKSVSF